MIDARWGEFVACDPPKGECIRVAAMGNIVRVFYVTPMVAQLNKPSYLLHHAAYKEFVHLHPNVATP